MMDIKEIITVLCKYLSDTVDSKLTPEHFRLAKYDESSDELLDTFWTTLDRLSYVALKSVNDRISLSDFDKRIRTKLRLSFLHYPFPDIYYTSESNDSSRVLLLALSWLISKYDVLKRIIHSKVVNSCLGREFSKNDISSTKESDDAVLSSVENQTNNLLHKTIKISQNLKSIFELQSEKVKLTTRVHTASITSSGLPHLTVSEMSLVKKMAINKNNNELKMEIEEKIKEMEKIVSMINNQSKWTKKSHVYHIWMNTVLDQYENTEEKAVNAKSLEQMIKFIYILRYIIRKKLQSLKNSHDPAMFPSWIKDCPSRLLRVQSGLTEIHSCLTDQNNQFDNINEITQKLRIELEKELKDVLKMIPNCVHI